MKTMKSKKNKKNKSQKAQQSFTERIAKAAGGFKERAKSMNSEEKAEQVQQPEQPETQQAQPEGGETEVDVKALQAELEKAKAQSDEYLDLAQRKQAEFANYRRRTEGIRAEAFDDGRREAISQLLPIVDNLERALAAAGEEDALKSGVEMVLRQTREALTKMGVDAELMDAVMQGTADEGEPGTVCMVLQKGYKLGERVIRHAMVKVVAG